MKDCPKRAYFCRQTDRCAAGKRNGPGPDEEASQPVENGPRSGVGGDASGEDARGGNDASAGLHNGAAADASQSAQTQAGVQSSGTWAGGSAGLAAAAASASVGAQPADLSQPCSEQRLPGNDNLRQAAAAPRAPANCVHAMAERGAGGGGEQRPAGAAKAGGPGSPLVDAARTWGSAEGGHPATRGASDGGAPPGQPSSQARHRNGYVDSGSRKRAGRAPRALSCCCARRGDDPAARPLHADASAPCARIIFICGLSARGRTEFYQARPHLWTCLDQSRVLGGQESAWCSAEAIKSGCFFLYADAASYACHTAISPLPL